MKHRVISRRKFVNRALLTMGSLAAHQALSSWCRAESAPPPNFLVLVVDDLRRDALGCYGNPVIQTPEIDRLASQGVRFEEAFVTSASNLSQPGVLTGIHERTHGYT